MCAKPFNDETDVIYMYAIYIYMNKYLISFSLLTFPW